MKFTLISLLFFSFSAVGQLKDACFNHADPYHGAEEKIVFTDSIFCYEYKNGTSDQSVKGNYSLSDDTLTLNSDFQLDDYQTTQTYDATIPLNSITLRILSIGDGHDVHVQRRVDKHHVSLFPGTVISSSKDHSLNDVHDTLIQLFEVPISDQMKELEIKIVHSAPAIIIPISENMNSYTIDVTSYPNDPNYLFFEDKKVVVHRKHLYFLTEKNEPEIYFKQIEKRNGVKEREKVKKYVKCT